MKVTGDEDFRIFLFSSLLSQNKNEIDCKPKIWKNPALETVWYNLSHMTSGFREVD